MTWYEVFKRAIQNVYPLIYGKLTGKHTFKNSKSYKRGINYCKSNNYKQILIILDFSLLIVDSFI